MGLDKAITSGKKEDYAKLACQLLNDPEMYQKWSAAAKAQYEKHADEKAYVREFESTYLPY